MSSPALGLQEVQTSAQELHVDSDRMKQSPTQILMGCELPLGLGESSSPQFYHL